jgi:hypothetical protein
MTTASTTTDATITTTSTSHHYLQVIEKTRPKRAKKDPAYKDPLDKLKAKREKAAARKVKGETAVAEKGESGSKLSASSRKSERNTSMVDNTDAAEDDDGDPDDNDSDDRDHSDHRDAHDEHGAGGITSANTSGSSTSSGPARRFNHLVSSCKRFFCVVLSFCACFQQQSIDTQVRESLCLQHMSLMIAPQRSRAQWSSANH